MGLDGVNILADANDTNDPSYLNKLLHKIRTTGSMSTGRGRRVPIHKRFDKTLNLYRLFEKNRNEGNVIKPTTVIEKAVDGYFDMSTKDIYGDQLYANICRTMNEFGKGRDKIRLRVDQRVMFVHCMNALLPLIYGNKLEANRKRLLKKLGLKRIIQEVIILASRRVGKTWFVAILLAAVMICFPKIEIACFSLALRTSQKMMRLVVDMLSRHETGRDMIIQQNQEKLKLRGDTPSTYKLLHSFPDRPDVCLFVFFLFFSLKI